MQACVFTRARISARTHSRTGTPARAHTQGYNKGRGGSAALLFPVSSPLWGSPPAPGPARRAPHPALSALRPQPAAGIPGRRVRNFAPGRQRLAARRAGDKSCGAAGGRAAKVCSLIVRKCVCARRAPAGAGRGRPAGAGGEERTPLPAPATRQRPAPGPGLENKLSALFSLGCGRGRRRLRGAGRSPGSLHSPHSPGSPRVVGPESLGLGSSRRRTLGALARRPSPAARPEPPASHPSSG